MPRETLAKAVELQARITEQVGPLPFVLVLNKAICAISGKFEHADASEQGWPVFETSAKSGTGVEEMFIGLARRC